jgi:tyrosyl-tRNA synthetase
MVDNGLMSSRKELKRIISHGGCYVDGRRMKDPEFMLDFDAQSQYMVRIGGRRVYFFEKDG